MKKTELIRVVSEKADISKIKAGLVVSAHGCQRKSVTQTVAA